MEKDLTITVLPELNFDHLEELMKERIAAAQTDHTVIPMLWQGLLEMKIPVNGTERTAKLFVPRHVPQGTVFVLMNVPEGQETLSFLRESGWMKKAVENGFCLFVLEPGPGGWGTPEQELPYLLAGFQAEIQGVYCLPAFAMYVVGYGAIGVGLHKAVMRDPLHVAAAAFLEAGGMDDTYLNEYRSKIYDRYDVPFREVPVPVWITAKKIESGTRAMVEYWRNAARAEASEFLPSGTIYTQNRPSPFTPEGNILKVIAQEKSCDACSISTTDEIYDFLKGYYRYGMGPCSNMISVKVDYAAWGVQRRTFTDRSGIRREYLVYLPAAFRGKDGKLPVVVAFHGASQSMRNMFENGLWYRIADREGIILVMPECTLEPLPPMLHGGSAHAYRPLWTLFQKNPGRHHLDVPYINELLDRVIAEFPADVKRIYGTGHSMGCMMIHYLGSSDVSHRFAAFGAMCGILQGREHTGIQKVPVFLTMGEYDLWDYDVSAETEVTQALDMWLERNGLAEQGAAREVRLHGAITSREGRRHHYTWVDEAGVPWLRYTWIEKRDHMNSPEENELFWNQWFSRWSLEADGLRHFDSSREPVIRERAVRDPSQPSSQTRSSAAPRFPGQPHL